MQIKPNFLLRNIADEYVVVPVDSAAVDFNGLIQLNETGAALWKHLEKDVSKEELVEKLTEEYEIDAAAASKHIEQFLKKLREADLLAGQ